MAVAQFHPLYDANDDPSLGAFLRGLTEVAQEDGFAQCHLCCLILLGGADGESHSPSLILVVVLQGAVTGAFPQSEL